MTALGEIVSIIKGGKATEVFGDHVPGSRRYLQIEDLRPGATIKYARDDEGVVATKRDVLIAWDGANAGTVGFSLEGFIGSTLAILRPRNNTLYAPFLGYFLQSKFQDIQKNCTGATIPHVNRDHLLGQKIPLHPILEQQRIAAILEKADRLRRLRRYALELAETFLQSVFLEMFGDPIQNQNGYKIIRLGEKIKFLTSGSRGWAKHYSEKGDLFIRIQNVGIGELILDDIAYVNAPINAESNRTQVRENDLLMSITADLGRVAVIPPNFPKAFVNQHLAIIRLSPDLIPTFIAVYFSTPSGKNLILRFNREGVKSGLNFDDIRSLPIFCPNKHDQEAFVEFVQRFQGLRNHSREGLRQTEHLFQTLLHRAFNDQL